MSGDVNVKVNGNEGPFAKVVALMQQDEVDSWSDLKGHDDGINIKPSPYHANKFSSSIPVLTSSPTHSENY